MRVIAPVLREAGRPMAMEDVEVHEPREGEVGVRMAASGVCHSCLHAYDGSHSSTPLPIILGDEGAGIVESVGPGVRHLVPGDRVILSWAPGCGRCRMCRSGRAVLCLDRAPFGRRRDGTTRFQAAGAPVHHFGPATYAPYTVVDADAAVRVEGDVALETAALVGCSVTTGVGAVTATARAAAGDSVAVFGCGGVGLNSVQGAALVGAHPIVAVDLSDAKLALARELGATHGVRADRADVQEQIWQITGGGADHAVVAVGSGSVMAAAAEVLAPAGTLVLVGLPPTGERMSIDPRVIIRGELRVLGSVYGSLNPHVDFSRLLELHRAGRLKLDELVSRRYGLEQADEAFADLARGRAGRGLIVFEPARV